MSGVTASPSKRAELAAFLRDRRARIRPADVGLPIGARRRNPGLRREEVALLVLCDTVSSDLFTALPHTRQEIARFIHQQMALMVAHLAEQRGKELDVVAIELGNE